VNEDNFSTSIFQFFLFAKNVMSLGFEPRTYEMLIARAPIITESQP